MSNRVVMKKILFIVSFIIVVLIFAGYFYFSLVTTDFKIKALYVKQVDDILYFKNLKRGLNYNELSISASKRKKINPKKDYIYTWDETIFYQVSNDTLYVLCKNKASEPRIFKSKIVVLQKEYSNPEYYELLENFKDIGMKKFP